MLPSAAHFVCSFELPVLPAIISGVGGYLAGSVPFGFLAGKLKGVDIRKHGSGNIGATNVFRTLGKSVGIPVFILDILKGLVPVMVAGWWFSSMDYAPDVVALLQIITAIATILGHNFTCFLRFKGGKGIATSAGALAGVIPMAVLAAVVVWIVLFLVTRIVSVGSLGGALTLPVAVLVQGAIAGEMNIPFIVFASVVSALAVWRHKSNIQRLMKGTENRFGSGKEKSSPSP